MRSAAARPLTRPLSGVRRAVVIGLGASGISAARLLVDAGVSVTIADERRDHPSAAQAAELGVHVVADVGQGLITDAIDLVVPSPGVPERSAVLSAALEGGTPVWSEPELALRRYPRRLVGITGTNGKTSTTELVTAMLRTSGLAAEACGNIGPTVCDVAASVTPETILVAELSSFQLRFVETLRPEVGVLLNFSADHLDWHEDLASYAAAKSRLWHGQTQDDWLVTNLDDPATSRLAASSTSRRASFSASRPVDVGVGNEDGVLTARLEGTTESFLEVGDLGDHTEPTPHHVANVAAAACVALLTGASPRAVAEAAVALRTGRHRFETVAVDARGVRYVNDSKATNVHAAVAALRAAGAAVWIAGGIAKGVDLSPLAAELDDVRAAVLIGDAAEELSEVCIDAGTTARTVASIEEAVTVAGELARPGDTVLLAPACSSFDQFASYQERGDRFTVAARRVAEVVAPGEGDQ